MTDMKRINLLPVILIFMPRMAGAQAANVQPAPPDWFVNETTYLLGFIFIMMAITIITLYSSFMKLSRSIIGESVKQETRPEQIQHAAEKKKIKRESWWLWFDRKFLTKGVPVEREEDVMFHHNYDGIRELDNKLPPWWVWGFYITIIWSAFYMLHFHVSGTGKLSAEEYRQEIAMAEKAKEERMRLAGENVTASNVTVLTAETDIAAGKSIFNKNCAACHLENGGGQVGPNLTDDYWIHGGGIKNIFRVISEGVPSKGMISWKAQLSPKQIQQVASYVMTLHGTNPPGAKEPQGELWQEQSSGENANAQTNM
jgi:cytochrome c oxidase cbb3-type subunit 3